MIFLSVLNIRFSLSIFSFHFYTHNLWQIVLEVILRGYTYITDFEVLTADFEGFIAALEKLCSKMAVEEEYSFEYE